MPWFTFYFHPFDPFWNFAHQIENLDCISHLPFGVIWSFGFEDLEEDGHNRFGTDAWLFLLGKNRQRMATSSWLSLSSFTKATDEQRLGPTWIWCKYFFVLLPQLDDSRWAKDYDHRVWTHVRRWRDLATVFFGIVAVRQTGSQNGCLNTRWTHMLINHLLEKHQRERCWSSCKQRRPASFSKIWELFLHLAGKCIQVYGKLKSHCCWGLDQGCHPSINQGDESILPVHRNQCCWCALEQLHIIRVFVYCILYSLYSYLNYHSIIEEWCDVCGDQMYRKKLSTLESACRMGWTRR